MERKVEQHEQKDGTLEVNQEYWAYLQGYLECGQGCELLVTALGR